MKKDLHNLKVTYIGGGSQAWARVLMNDLAVTPEIGGRLYLYDIDNNAAENNKIIGNRLSSKEDIPGKWTYITESDIGKALKDADFVIISVLPGTFDEMESDVHYPEKYNIYQTVGDTTGPGGYIRAMRCVPIFRYFASKVKENCPDAWVINYTNPMTLCVRILYEEFPQIKAFGCCHEVFGTQYLLSQALKEIEGIEVANRDEICVDVCGINHFTWITKANYKNIDLFPVFREYGKVFLSKFKNLTEEEKIWKKNTFACADIIKFTLFEKYGVLPAAGDRHLAEFMPSKWFLESPEAIIEKWGFNRTSVAWRKEDLIKRIETTRNYVSSKEELLPSRSQEEGIRQIKALLGLERLVTNINIPNCGQIPDFPLGAIVETNGLIGYDDIRPLIATPLPSAINSLITRHINNQEAFIKAAFEKDIKGILNVLCNNPLCDNLNFEQVNDMFYNMIKNTQKYLKDYWY